MGKQWYYGNNYGTMEKKYGTIDTIPKTLEPLTMNKYKKKLWYYGKNYGSLENTIIMVL